MAPSSPLDPFKALADKQLASWRSNLTDGRLPGANLAIIFRVWQLMTEDIEHSPQGLSFWTKGFDPSTGKRGPEWWQQELTKRATVEIIPENSTDKDAAAKKFQQYMDFGQKLVDDANTRFVYTALDKETGTRYLVTENELTTKIFKEVQNQLNLWVLKHLFDSKFAGMPVHVGYYEFLKSRKDIVVLLRTAQDLPMHTRTSPEGWPQMYTKLIVETGISFIPVFGNMVAAYEAISGESLFGDDLSDFDRALLAGCVILPVAARLFKGGKLLYAETRLVRLYGIDASAASKAVQAAARVADNPQVARTLRAAEADLAKSGRIGANLLKDGIAAAEALSKSAAVNATVDKIVVKTFEDLCINFPILKTLDSFAVERILLKGPNVSHIKGQIVEELLHTEITTWLSQRWGKLALGIEAPVGRQLEAFPGYLIRDAQGRAFLDELIGYVRIDAKGNKVITSRAIFQCKAGRYAARELSFSRTSISSLTKAEALELRAYANDILRERVAAAAATGTSYTSTVETVEKEIILSETGGQIARDIERSSAGVDGRLPEVWIGGEKYLLEFSRRDTRIFAVVPKGLSSTLTKKIVDELAREHLRVEVRTIEMSEKEVADAAKGMEGLAGDMAQNGGEVPMKYRIATDPNTGQTSVVIYDPEAPPTGGVRVSDPTGLRVSEGTGSEIEVDLEDLDDISTTPPPKKMQVPK